MRRRSVFIIAVLVAILSPPLTVLVAEEVAENIQSRVLESFDPETRGNDWVVVGSKFATEGFPRTTYAKVWPNALHGLNRENIDYEVLGVNGSFERQGFNYVEIIPVKTGDGGEIEHSPITVPGIAKSIDLWVWSSKYNYNIKIQLIDYNGKLWTLDLGNLYYVGWRNLKVDVPSYIPQAESYVPHLDNLRISKLIMWTLPDAQVADFYIYLDHLKVVADTFEARFDGDILTWPAKIEEIWASSVEGGVVQ